MLNPKVERVAKEEMQRRQKATLSLMKAANVDAIILGNSGDMYGGQYRWLLDASGAYPPQAIFCEEGIAFFTHGIHMELNANPEFVDIGGACPVRKWSTPSIPPITFRQYDVPKAMETLIKSRGWKRVGYCGMNYVPATVSRYLEANLKDVEFVDFTESIDHVRMVKSEYEIGRWMKSVDLHDKLIASISNFMRPHHFTGHTLNLEIMRQAADLGAIEFNTVRICPWRNDEPLNYFNDTIEAGDYFYVLVEVTGTGGEWGECGRLFRLGEEPEQKWIDRANQLLTIRNACAEKMVPGAIPQEIFRFSNELRAQYGWAPERRIFAHGQSYDIVDRPLFVEGDLVPLEENIFFAMHPNYYADNGIYFDFTDDYLVKKGGAVRLSKTPEIIIPITID